jgi:hypothetical protein
MISPRIGVKEVSGIRFSMNRNDLKMFVLLVSIIIRSPKTMKPMKENSTQLSGNGVQHYHEQTR